MDEPTAQTIGTDPKEESVTLGKFHSLVALSLLTVLAPLGSSHAQTVGNALILDTFPNGVGVGGSVFDWPWTSSTMLRASTRAT